jgi:hypothetical protein
VYYTKTKVGETKTTYLTTKTIYATSTGVDYKPFTTVNPYPVTSVGASSTTITSYVTELKTKSHPVVVTTYTTTVLSEVKTKTKVEKVPYT